MTAYWLTSASIAWRAASLSSSGHGKSGKPWARLIAPCSAATLVISRITDSVKRRVRAAVRLAVAVSFIGATLGHGAPTRNVGT